MAEKPWEGSFNKLYVCMYVCMWKGPEFLYNVEEEWSREDNAHSENENAMKEIVKNPATITHV